jgi:hypothetical protein
MQGTSSELAGLVNCQVITILLQTALDLYGKYF